MKRVISLHSQRHSLGKGEANFLAEKRCPGEGVFLADDGAKGHRLGSRQRESSLSQLLTAESELLRAPRAEENARTCALFSSFLQRAQKSPTGWRRGGDLNPRNPSEFTRSPGVRLKPGSATSPRAGGQYAICARPRATGRFAARGPGLRRALMRRRACQACASLRGKSGAAGGRVSARHRDVPPANPHARTAMRWSRYR